MNVQIRKKFLKLNIVFLMCLLYLHLRKVLIGHFKFIFSDQNGDEGSPSINLAGRSLFVKMSITLEPHDAFGSNFAYLYI